MTPQRVRTCSGKGCRGTWRTRRSTSTCWTQVELARDQGYAASFEERHDGVGSISAPVFDHAGELAAVLGIGAPTQRVTEDDVDKIAPLVVAAGHDASAALGYRPSKIHPA